MVVLDTRLPNVSSHAFMHCRGVGRWFGKGELYRSIGKGSMISVYKIEPSYVTIRKYRGHQPLEPPWFLRLCIEKIGEGLGTVLGLWDYKMSVSDCLQVP